MIVNLLSSLPMLTCLFWLVCYLLDMPRLWQQSGHEPPKMALTLFFAATFILYGCHYLYFSGIEHPVFETIYAVANLCVFPIFYIYLLLLTNNPTRKAVRYGFIPAVVILVAYTLCFIFGWESVRHGFYIAARICFAAQVAFVWFFGYRLLTKYKRQLDDYYSDNRGFALQRVNILLQLIGLTAIVAALLNAIGREWFDDNIFLTIPALFMTIMLYGIGFEGSKIPYLHIASTVIADEINIAEDTSTAEEPTTFGNDHIDNLIKRFEQLINEEKLYLNPELTSGDIVQLLGTNRTYVSEMFRDHYNTSFSQYINHLRVEYAKQLLSDKRFGTNKEAIMEAMLQSGFSSESSFYRIFKQETGMAPLAYRLKHIEK